MKTYRPRVFRPRSRQRGLSTLLIAILLLAIVTIITIFAARFGIFEQRMSANDYRYKMAFQVSEAGLNQSMEFIKMSTVDMLSTATDGWLDPVDPTWQPCTDALPDDMLIDPCLAEPNDARRGEMYRYVGNSASAQDGILPVEALMPELGADGDDVEEFAAEYTSYATLCRLDISIPDSPRCALNPVTEDTFYVTVVSQGRLPDENATATVKQSFGTFRTIGAAPSAPLIAAGTIVGLGNAEIVPNPDAGGFNVPVSIWAKVDANIDDTGPGGVGSFSSCQLGEWLTTGTPESTTDGVCADCTCSKLDFGYGMLSGHKGGTKLEGEDILDVDGHASEAVPKVRDSKYFPPDLFEYVFSVPSDDAEDFLNANATVIDDCGTLTEASSGLFWYQGPGDCDVGDAGTLQAPAVIVSDQKVVLNGKPTVFGIIYVRNTGGGDLLKANGGQVYGSVIIEGGGKLAGSPSIVYNKTALQNIRNSPNFLRYGPVPGSWSDTLE